MDGSVIASLLLCLTVVAQADYDCLCNYHVETQLYSSPDRRLSPTGYLYEFDCQPIVTVDGLDQQWIAVAKNHRIHYVFMDNQIKILKCTGNPPPGDILPPTPTTHITTDLTTANAQTTGKTSPNPTTHTISTLSTQPSGVVTTQAKTSPTPTTPLRTLYTQPSNITTPTPTTISTAIPINSSVPINTTSPSNTQTSTHIAGHVYISTSNTPPTVSAFYSTHNVTNYASTTTQTGTVKMSHTSNMHISTTGGISPSQSTHTTALTTDASISSTRSETISQLMVSTTPSSSMSPSTARYSATPTRIHAQSSTTYTTGTSSKHPTTILVNLKTTTDVSKATGSTDNVISTTDPHTTITTSTPVNLPTTKAQAADISPEMSQSILFLLNEERSLRAQLDSDANKLETELNTLASLTQNATCGCPAPLSTPIAFSAVLSHNIATLGLQQMIVFDHVYTNYGNGYDVRHGVFTAPVDGAYEFTVAMLVPGGKWSGVEIVVNRRPLAKTRSGDDSFYTMGTNVVTAQLSPGDEVFVRHISETDNNVIYGDSFSSFTGYLIG